MLLLMLEESAPEQLNWQHKLNASKATRARLILIVALPMPSCLLLPVIVACSTICVLLLVIDDSIKQPLHVTNQPTELV
jgi:hypothetical protein